MTLALTLTLTDVFACVGKERIKFPAAGVTVTSVCLLLICVDRCEVSTGLKVSLISEALSQQKSVNILSRQGTREDRRSPHL